MNRDTTGTYHTTATAGEQVRAFVGECDCGKACCIGRLQVTASQVHRTRRRVVKGMGCAMPELCELGITDHVDASADGEQPVNDLCT